MKKYLYSFVAIVVIFSSIACGNTTKESEETNQNSAPDTAAVNSSAANTIYRDSADIVHATESGGGTGNPANMDSTHK